jgi:tetratricopeptide (TPR) repeat protein
MRMAARTGWSVRTLAQRLTDQRRRLDELTAGHLGVRASIDVSYSALHRPGSAGQPDVATAFRLLARFTGTHLTRRSAAAALGVPVTQARRTLDSLVEVHLLQSPGAGVYRYHDLVRAYANERSQVEDPPEVRDASLGSLLAWTLHAAAQAAVTLAPSRVRSLSDAPDPVWSVPQFSGYDQALRWCREEHQNLLRAVWQAAESGRHDLAWKLAFKLYTYLSVASPLDEVFAVLTVGLHSAERIRSDEGRGALLNVIGIVEAKQGLLEDAAGHFLAALELRRSAGNKRGEAACLSNIGEVYGQLGRVEEAIATLRQSIALFEEAGGQYRGTWTAYTALARTYLKQGQFADARDVLLHCLSTSGDGGVPTGWLLNALASAYAGLGDYELAIPTRERALEQIQATGHLLDEAEALQDWAADLYQLGRNAEAEEHMRRAAELFADLGHGRAAAVAAADTTRGTGSL